MKGKRPKNPAYPSKLETLGDHLRKVRLDGNLSQPEVAKILKVSTDTIIGWELNRYEPTAKLAKSAIDYLGYNPFLGEEHSLGKQLYHARLITGKTQKEVAEVLGCDESNLRYIELGQRKPQPETLGKILGYIRNAGNT